MPTDREIERARILASRTLDSWWARAREHRERIAELASRTGKPFDGPTDMSLLLGCATLIDMELRRRDHDAEFPDVAIGGS